MSLLCCRWRCACRRLQRSRPPRSTLTRTPVQEVLSVADEVEGKAGWAAGSVPLARDVDGNLLVAWGEDGSVREWDAEDGVAEYAQARSLGAYLEDLRNKVLSRRVEFVDGVGVVETQASPVRGASVGK